MACFVQLKVYKIGENSIRTIELRNDNQTKTIDNFGMDINSNTFVKEIEFWYFLYVDDTENT